MYIDLHVKYTLFFPEFNESWIFWIDFFFFEILLPDFMKIRVVGAEFYRVGGRTDGHDEANSRFSQFCEFA
jgi:hypothetical protein